LPEIIDEAIGSESVNANARDTMIYSSTAVGTPVVAYVSKMVAIPESEMSKEKREA
jgi:ribosome assembly protein 1